MRKLWLEDEKKVFLAKFTDSLMIKDTDKKYSFIEDFWRKKTYVKDEDKFLPHFKQEFSEPYRVAQVYCGGTWNDYNTPFTIQIGLCNLNCFWCFVSKDLRQSKIGNYFTAKQIVQMWVKNEKNGILRITGGEPFLAPDFLIEIGKEIRNLNQKQRYLWIDTNLLGKNYEEVVEQLSKFNIPFGICGCFKGFDKKHFYFNTNSSVDLFEKQFKNAKLILQNMYNKGELFFYVPEFLEIISTIEIEKRISKFYDFLISRVHKLAPLRVTVLKIKTYETNQEKMQNNRIKSGLTRKIWLKFIQSKYPTNMIWLPQNQIKLN